MERRHFLGAGLAGGAALSAQAAQSSGSQAHDPTSYTRDLVIERNQPGKPHRGKMLAAIQPHTDDIAIFAGGTVLKLIDEGYEGILINLSNDEMAGTGETPAEVIWNNERDTLEVAKRLGLKETVFLGYRNHLMDGDNVLEMRQRLIFLFRLYKVDTVVVYDPSGLYERNPDHYVTAKSVEAACWMAGSRHDYPEHFKAGLEPHSLQEKYYFSRGPQIVNRVVDIGTYMDAKVWANVANVTQGPAGDNGARLRKRLAEQGRKLALLGDDDETANRQYTKQFALRQDKLRGERHGIAYAEYFHYIGPEEDYLEQYIRENAQPL
jgi:LmbE family N-acetylglucosaminyl deacetylase